MSLRRTIFVAVFLAVFATASLEGVFDVVVDRFAGQSDDRLLFDLIDIPLMLVIAVVGAWLISRHVARPLRSLTAATRQVAEQSFPSQVTVPAGDDELAQLSRSFNTMAASIHGFVEREKAFTRYASHELRSPLSAMRLQIERAELGLMPAADVLPVLRRQVTQLEEILAALLALARSSSPEVESRLLAPLVVESLATFPVEQRSRFTVTDDSPAKVKVLHSRLLQQALTNLLDNALRHGSGSATVRVHAANRSVTVTVLDTGPGVEPAELERVTEPFFRGGDMARGNARGDDRAGTSHSPEGFGLGLAFVSFIAKALEGSLTLHNTESGLEATLTLPIVDGPSTGFVATA